METVLENWWSTQRQREDGAVESTQVARVPKPVVETSDAGAALLGRRYWETVRRATGGIVRARETAGSLELRLFTRGPVLLSFGAPELSSTRERVECRYPIKGGLLARAPTGAITLAQDQHGEVELSSRITGFFPRLGARPGRPDWTGALYAHVQSRIHVAISRRYFAGLAGRRR